MLLQIPDVLNGRQVAEIRRLLGAADWIDGNATSGEQSAQAKRNRQLPEDSELAQQLGQVVLTALSRSPLFISAALPQKVFPPLFNSYAAGETFGAHIDNAIRRVRGTDQRVRSDLSATLFLSGPADYDGGALQVHDTFGCHEVKLPAGHMALYPASSLHEVTPVSRGERLAAFFWVQSMVREDAARSLLFDLDTSVQALAGERGQKDPPVIRLTGIYHNLLRRWAEV